MVLVAQNVVGIEVIADATGIRSVTAQVDKLSQTLNKLNKESTGFAGFTKNISNATKSFSKLTNASLSLLFAGFALQRAFTGVLKSIFSGMTELLGKTHVFSIAVEKLKAAFGFLKFAIIDALSQSPLFVALVDHIIQLTERLGDFISEHPKLAEFIVTFLAIGAAVGFVLFVLGQIGSSLTGLGALFKIFATILNSVFNLFGIRALASFGAVRAAFAGLIAALTGLSGGWVLLIILLIVFLVAAFKENFGSIQDFFKVLFFGIFEFLKSIFLDIFKVLTETWKALIAFINGDTEKGLLALARAFLAAFRAILNFAGLLAFAVVNIFALMVNLISKLFLDGLVNNVLGAIKLLIRGLNKLPGVKIDTSGIDRARTEVDQFIEKIKIAPIAASEFKFGDVLGKDVEKLLPGIKEPAAVAAPTPTVPQVNITTNVSVAPGVDQSGFDKVLADANNRTLNDLTARFLGSPQSSSNG